MALNELLQQTKKQVLDEAVGAINRSHLPGYERIGEKETRARLEKLLNLVISSVNQRSVKELLTYVERMAEDRFYAGVDLSEVQAAINVLEETIWRHILTDLGPKQYPEALGLIGTVLGWAKDSLARKYVELASKRKVPSMNLQEWMQ